MVSTTSRVSVFREVHTLLNSNKPTYTGKGDITQTYVILSAFPEEDPVFPCIVINPLIKRGKKLGVKQSSNSLSAKGEIEIEFFSKTSDGKNAIDSALDSVEDTIETNDFSSFYLTKEPFEDSGVDILEVGGQKLNIATLTVNITIR